MSFTWTQQNSGIQSWFSVASSSDGTKLVACSIINNITPNSGFIYTSSDSGATWNQTNAGLQSWRGIASSSD
jgi:hypothetical protein